jgi:hypothetical protein
MTMKDDNEKILELIQERMAIGEERYGHGIRKNDDTKQWGTKTDSWTEMGLEEALDLTIYLSAQLIRLLDKEEEQERLDKLRVEHVLKLANRIKELETMLERYEAAEEKFFERTGRELMDDFPLL